MSRDGFGGAHQDVFGCGYAALRVQPGCPEVRLRHL